MKITLLSKEDLNEFKQDILEEIKKLLKTGINEKEYLKSADVIQILGCSQSTLQTLRISGELPFSKIGGTIYYMSNDLRKLVEKNKKNAA